MGLFRHILFPVDFSTRCKAVAPAVLGMANHCQSRLTLFHALDLPPGAYADWYAFSAMVDMEAIRKHETKFLEDFLAGETGELQVARVLLDGPPVAMTVKHADETGVDLIMLPTHGYGRFRSLLLGSVTAGILHDAHCPVWTAAHSEEGGVPLDGKYCRILCATDLSAATPKLLDWAQSCARSFGAELQVVHILPAVADPVHSASAAEFRRHIAADAQERFAEMAKRAGVQMECTMIEGEAGESVGTAVARQAVERHADLVLAGRGAIQGTFGRLRTHVSDIIRMSPCPVLSI